MRIFFSFYVGGSGEMRTHSQRERGREGGRERGREGGNSITNENFFSFYEVVKCLISIMSSCALTLKERE